MSEVLCDFCERGTLQPTKIARVFDYKGDPLVVQGYTVLVCDQCGEHVTGVTEARVNERLILEAKRKADNLMSGTQVKALRERLGLSQELASQLFGGGPHAFSKYERGEVAQSTAADRLMRIAEMYPAVLGNLADIQKAAQMGQTDKSSLNRSDNAMASKHYPKGLDKRPRDQTSPKAGQIREKRADTKVDTLRKEYGTSFAKGFRSDAQLGTVREATGKSLHQLVKDSKKR